MSDNTNYNYGYPVPKESITVMKSADGVYNKPGMPKPPAGWGKKLGEKVSLAPDSCIG